MDLTGAALGAALADALGASLGESSLSPASFFPSPENLFCASLTRFCSVFFTLSLNVEGIDDEDDDGFDALDVSCESC